MQYQAKNCTEITKLYLNATFPRIFNHVIFCSNVELIFNRNIWKNERSFSSADGKPGILTHGYGSLVSANDYDSEILRLDLYDDTTVLNFFP